MFIYNFRYNNSARMEIIDYKQWTFQAINYAHKSKVKSSLWKTFFPSSTFSLLIYDILKYYSYTEWYFYVVVRSRRLTLHIPMFRMTSSLETFIYQKVINCYFVRYKNAWSYRPLYNNRHGRLLECNSKNQKARLFE